ncbi:MAG: DUF362 domain-containing protein [Candidatus Aminicenantes bacterium]|nr:MAG: DUF362 domain-containing protein [Candidatus Aminicenantes bacterium]
MKKAKVAIVKASDYESKEISAGLKKGLALLGGLEKIIKPKSKVFVKINHLSSSSPPERGIITHPAFTKEVLRLLKEFDLEITVGDDIHSGEQDGFMNTGYRQVCEELGVRLVNLKEIGFQEIDCNSRLLRKVYMPPLILGADYILNLPKLKTHSFTMYTGAVKNMFGIIPHGLKIDYHRKYVGNDVFSQMLVDLFSCVPPQLTIMDGIIAMEGEGPSGGNTKKVGLIFASQDAVAVDAVATKIVGFDPMDIYTTFHAHEKGLGIGAIEDIEITGESIHDIQVKDFKQSAVAVNLLRRKIPSFLYGYLQAELRLIPEVSPEKCTLCLECVEICPCEAIQSGQDSTWIDKKLCINCMCCHEACQFQAIRLKQRPIGRMIRKGGSLLKRIKSIMRR